MGCTCSIKHPNITVQGCAAQNEEESTQFKKNFFHQDNSIMQINKNSISQSDNKFFSFANENSFKNDNNKIEINNQNIIQIKAPNLKEFIKVNNERIEINKRNNENKENQSNQVLIIDNSNHSNSKNFNENNVSENNNFSEEGRLKYRNDNYKKNYQIDINQNAKPFRVLSFDGCGSKNNTLEKNHQCASCKAEGYNLSENQIYIDYFQHKQIILSQSPKSGQKSRRSSENNSQNSFGPTPTFSRVSESNNSIQGENIIQNLRGGVKVRSSIEMRLSSENLNYYANSTQEQIVHRKNSNSRTKNKNEFNKKDFFIEEGVEKNKKQENS